MPFPPDPIMTFSKTIKKGAHTIMTEKITIIQIDRQKVYGV